jgi:TolB-like protein/Flp pilus assembly protein TadD
VNRKKFFGELKRRNVYKVAAAYAVAGWALSQGIAQVLPVFDIPNSAVRLIVLLIVIGFPVAVILAWAFELTPEGIKRTENVDLAAQGPSRSHGWIYVVIIGGALAIGLFFFGRYTARNQTATAELPTKSIAVLPFKPVTPENRDQVLEMGMADSLISKLSSTGGIVVPSLTSVRKYAALDQDPVVAGRELQVKSVLEGNVQKSGDHIRVTARLINVADGSALWAGTFDEKFTDVFAVQDAISQKTADALALKLDEKGQKRLTKRDTENVEAYQLYLTGRYHYARLIPAEIRTALSYFQQAIDKDPTYALAYFGLAEANRSLAITADVPSKDCLPQAKAAATKALEIDDSLAEAHASLSFTLIWFDWNWAGGEREAKRALTLNPNSAMAHFAYAHILSDLGRHNEAVAQATRARELDPLFLLVRALEGMFLHHAGRNDEALISLRKALDLDPNFWVTHLTLGKVYLQERKYPEAIAEFSKAKELSHGNSEAIASIGYTAALAGDKAKGRAVLEELKVVSKQHYVPPVNIALVYEGLGDQNEAFSWLEKACEERDVRLTLLKVDPRWDSFRSSPRFAAILGRVGLQ